MDISEPATAALEFALGRFPDAEITVLYTSGLGESEAGLRWRVLRSECEEERERQETVAAGVFRAAAAAAERADVTVSTALEHGHPIRAIVAYAEDHDIDRIVIGTHDRGGVSRLLLGSVAETVVRQSSVPVTVKSLRS